MRIQALPPRPVFYYGDTPVRADRWFYQSGDYWCAVAPGESAAEWFEDDSTPRGEWPAVREYPITVMPPSGVLRWRRYNGEDAEYCIPHSVGDVVMYEGKPRQIAEALVYDVFTGGRWLLLTNNLDFSVWVESWEVTPAPEGGAS